MHDASLATLEDVIDFYDAGGRPNPFQSPFIRPLYLDDYERAALVAFLRTLTDHNSSTLRLKIRADNRAPCHRRYCHRERSFLIV